MPTGYTHDIEKEDFTFEEFTLGCAKAFGACISMRDLPSNTTIPDEFKVEPYYQDKILETQKQIEKHLNLTLEEWGDLCDKDFEQKESRRVESLNKNIKLLDNYNKMLAKTKEWQPPSEEHLSLKEFMINQIEESIDFDCDVKYYNKPNVKVSVDVFKSETIVKLYKDLEYYTKNNEEEIKRVSQRNLWVKQLRESLK